MLPAVLKPAAWADPTQGGLSVEHASDFENMAVSNRGLDKPGRVCAPRARRGPVRLEVGARSLRSEPRSGGYS